MKSVVISEDSGTTLNRTDIPFAKYYQGGFLPVASLKEQLAHFGQVDLFIFSEQYGLIRGEELVGEKKTNELLETEPNFSELLRCELDCLNSAEVVVILLSGSLFDTVIVENWDEIVKNSKEGSVWCVGAAQTVLNSVDFDQLRTRGCEVLTYQRVGVARIGNQTRDDLLELVESKYSP